MDLPRERRLLAAAKRGRYTGRKEEKKKEKKKTTTEKRKREEEETRVGALVKRNIVHAPARRNICLLSVYTFARVRFLLWYRRDVSASPLFLVLSLLCSLSLSLSFTAFSFFAASWLRKPTINPRRQLGISWRHDFTKPYRSPFSRSVATTAVYSWYTPGDRVSPPCRYFRCFAISDRCRELSTFLVDLVRSGNPLETLFDLSWRPELPPVLTSLAHCQWNSNLRVATDWKLDTSGGLGISEWLRLPNIFFFFLTNFRQLWYLENLLKWFSRRFSLAPLRPRLSNVPKLISIKDNLQVLDKIFFI